MDVTSRRAAPAPRSRLRNELLLTTHRVYSRIRFALLIEGRLPETVHRRSKVWRPAVRLVIACSGGTGPVRRALRPALRGARCTRCGGNAADGSTDPEPKNRHGRSAERRASYVISAFTRVLRRTMGREAPRKRLACGVIACRTGAQRRIRAPVGAPPTPQRWESISPPGRNRAAGTPRAV